MTYKDALIPLDIIITYDPRSWLHVLIHDVTGYKAGHVALYLGDGMIVEATRTGVHRRPWKNYKAGTLVKIARVKSLNEFSEIKIRNYCFESESRPYAFGQLIFIFLKNLFHARHVPDCSKQAVICSEFVAESFLAGWIKLCGKLKPHETTPGNILKSDKVEVYEM